MDLPGKLQSPFGLQLDPNQTNLDQLKMDLQGLGFTVERLDVNPDPTTHDLVRLSKDFSFGAGSVSFSVGGIGGGSAPGKCDGLGFCYFDDHVAGGLNITTLSANVQPITFHVTFGVDLVNGQPQLFVQDSTPDAQGYSTGLDAFTVSGQTHVTGTMNLRNLLNVQIAGDAVLNLTAGLNFKSPSTDHKLRLADLTTTNVIGALNGSAKFANVTFTTKLPILPDLSWAGQFIGNITTDAFGNKTVTPSSDTGVSFPPNQLWSDISGFVSGLSKITPSLDFLKPISDALNFKVPLFNFTLGDKLGLGDLSKITSLSADISGINNDIQKAENILNPIGIYIGIPPLPANISDTDKAARIAKQPKTLTDIAGLISQVIQGNRVDLLSFSTSGGNRWGQQFCFTFLDLGVPGVADVHLDACFGGYVGWDYYVGLGIDTTGFYIDPSTHIGVSGGIDAGLHGGLRVLGFDLASADGDIGLDASARLSIRNPDPSQGEHVYLDEIFNGGNLFQSILDALQVDFTIDVTAHVEAKLNLFFATITLFSHDWDLGRLVDIHVPVATTQSKRAMRLNFQTQDLSQDPAVSFSNGVLTLNGSSGTAANPNLVLLSGKDHTVDVNWQGHGIGHFTGVNKVVFTGGSGNDRIQVKPGFNIPIDATGGNGNNYFEASDGGTASQPTILRAGNGNSTLIGDAGNDQLIGGTGNDFLQVGNGDSTLIGGGNATLYGGAGHDLLIGGASADANDATTGHDYIRGGIGDSTIWAGGGVDTIIAGAGNDVIHGGRGININPPHYDQNGKLIKEDGDLIIAGVTLDPTTSPPLVSGGGKDTIWGGSGDMTVRGGAGDDEIHGGTGTNWIQGGTGNNLIYGGPNSDLLIAGTGNDRLYSASDVNHKTTLVAGPGEDWLYAGNGDDLLRLPFDVNTGGVRSHFVGGSGHDILAVTTDAKNHIIRLTQSSATNFTATSYADAAETQPLGSFSFEVPSDLHGNFIQTLALEAINGNNKLDVAPQVGKNIELIGGTGNDTLVGGGGINTLMGGTGNDLLIGGPGTSAGTYNEFHGGTGSTTMIGGAGADIFYGGTGDNYMQGANGRVIMYGGKSLPGQRNHDTMQVGAQSQGAVMIGGANDVTMYGGPGNNVLLGGDGNAEMHGGAADDVLVGGKGNDTMYGGNGYEVLIGGQGNNVQYVNDPTRSVINRSTEDWQTRFDRLQAQSDKVAQEIDKIAAQMNGLDPNSAAYQALKTQKDRLVAEHDSIVKAQDQLDQEYLQHTTYHVPDYVIGGAGVNEIHGSTLANFLIAGTGPTTFYSGGGDDTVTGTPGKDTFFIPPLPDNSTIIFTAVKDSSGHYIPAVTIDPDTLNQTELVHVRGISQIGIITGAGTNTITVDLGGHVINGLDGINVQCTTGNNYVNVKNFPGRVTVQAGSGTDTVVGGSAAGLELDGGTGLSTYEVDGNGVQVRAEGSPSMLSIYANGALQSKITKTTFRRLSIQGQPGTNSLVLGPLGGFSFPELIASAGWGSKTLDVSAVTQRVTLLGGAGNDTLIGGSGFTYFQGGTGDTLVQNYIAGDTVRGEGGTIRYGAGDDFSKDDGGYHSPLGWYSQLVNSASDANFVPFVAGGYMGNAFRGWDRMPSMGFINVVNLFTANPYWPVQQGAISAVDMSFGFTTVYCSWTTDCNVTMIPVVMQAGYFFQSTSVVGPWIHDGRQYFSLAGMDSSSFFSNGLVGYQPGAPLHPNFSSSGAPVQIGLLTGNYNGSQGFIQTAWQMEHFQVTVHAVLTTVAASSFRIVPSTLSSIAGVPFTVTVTALDSAGNVATGYRGTVHFSSNDGAGLLPSDYTFTAADNGVHTFFAVLKSAGSRTLTVTQTDVSFVSGTATVNVLPAAVDNFQLTWSPSPATAGSPINFTVVALDHYGNVATGYRGTVAFRHDNRDPGARLPADYTFTAADNGVHTFANVALLWAGQNNVIVADTTGQPRNGFFIAVLPAAAASFQLTVPAAPVTAGSTFTVTATAVDAYGNIVTSYRGTVHPPASDGQMTLPRDSTFTAGDNGVHTFSVTLTQAGSRIITIEDTNYLIGSTAVTVAPLAAVSLTLSTAPAAAGAGALFQITVTARDRYNNVATGYRGTVHFSSGDTQATLPADYPFTAADQGTKTFAVTTRTAGLQTLQVADTGNTMLRTSLNAVVLSAAATSLGVTAAANSITAGSAFTLTVTAYDAYGNVASGYTGTVHLTSSDGQAVLPGNYTFTAADQGIHAFTVILKTAANQTITATDTQNSGMTNMATVTVTPAAATSLRLMPAVNPADAGLAFNLTVTALDPYGNVDPSYTGTVHFSSSDAQATLPSDTTFAAADQGVHVVSIILRTAGSPTLTVLDTVNGSITGTAPVTVRPGAAQSLQLTGLPATIAAGAHFSVTVTALDQFGNVASGYTGTVTFSSSDPQATLPPDYTFTTGDSGTHIYTDLIDRLAGNQNLTVSDNGNGLMATGILQVTPATASQFQVAGFPSPITAGMSGTFTVTALDPFGNVDVNYRGTVTFSSSDPGSQVMLPTNYTFSASDFGVHTFSATLVTAGTQSLTVADSQFPLSINSTQGGILVVAAAADHFLITTSVDGSSTVAGSPFDVTVSVQDLYGNTVTGYTGTVTFSSYDPYGATLPADYTFTSDDQGTATFSGITTLYTAGIWDVTATDIADNTISGSDNITVTPASATHFQITAPATVMPGMPFDVTVTALDRYGNVDVNYQGTVTFTTTDGDPGVMVPLDYTFTAADAGVHTFAGGFTLMTLGDQTITATDTANALITGMATVTVASTGGPGADTSGKRTTAIGAGSSPAQATTPVPIAWRDEADPFGPNPWVLDHGSRPLGLEPRSVLRPFHTPDALGEVLDQLFSEDWFH